MSYVADMYRAAKSMPVKSERDRLVLDNMALVATVCANIRRNPTDDMIQNGMIGLINAANTFDPNRGPKFSTYACVCIWSSVVNTWSKEQRKRLPLAEMNPDALAQMIEDKQAPQPDYEAMDRERRQKNAALISRALNAMGELDRAAVVARYWRGETCKEIGHRWGVSKQRIDQRIKVGMREARIALGVPRS